MGCLLSIAACCFCQSAASLCCACLPSCKSSTASRVMYTIMLVCVALISICFLMPGVEKLPSYLPDSDGQQLKGFGGVYRVCFGATIFYLFFSLIMIGVKSSSDIRAKIQNGFWFFKFLFLGLIIFGSLYLPVGFNYPWMHIGMFGGSLFLIIQLIFIIDMAHTWNDKWLTKYEDESSKIHACGLLFTTIFFYISSIVAASLLYVYYANDESCGLQKGFISLNIILCFIVSVISILPKVHEYFPKSGLLQSSMITLYVIFLTWSALSNHPNKLCNFDLSKLTTNGTSEIQNFDQLSEGEQIDLKFNFLTIVSLLMLLVTVGGIAFKSSSGSSTSRLVFADDKNTSLPLGSDDKSNGGQVVWDNEEDEVAYNYSLMHFYLALAALYLMVTLTNWYSPYKASVLSLNVNYSSFWVKIASSWVCIFLYGWTLTAPCLFPDRDFS